MVYQWMKGSRVRGSAQQVGEAVERIRVANKGSVEPSDIVLAAEKEHSPLHPLFDWDDKVAGAKWRIEQAKYIVRALVLVPSEQVEGAPEEEMRAFVSLRDESDGSPAYTSTMAAMRDPAMRQRIVQRAHDELESWHRRYRQYEELAEAVAAVEQALRQTAASV